MHERLMMTSQLAVTSQAHTTPTKKGVRYNNKQKTAAQENADAILSRLMASPPTTAGHNNNNNSKQHNNNKSSKQHRHNNNNNSHVLVNLQHVHSTPVIQHTQSLPNTKTPPRNQSFTMNNNNNKRPNGTSRRRAASSAEHISGGGSPPRQHLPAARLSPLTGCTYAGAKFSDSPQPRELPPPPIRWVLDSLREPPTAVMQSPREITVTSSG